MSLNPDQISNADVTMIANATMSVVDNLQTKFPAAVQTVAIAAAFKLLVERHGLSMQDILGPVDNIINDTKGKRPEFSAVAQYLAEQT